MAMLTDFRTKSPPGKAQAPRRVLAMLTHAGGGNWYVFGPVMCACYVGFI